MGWRCRDQDKFQGWSAQSGNKAAPGTPWESNTLRSKTVEIQWGSRLLTEARILIRYRDLKLSPPTWTSSKDFRTTVVEILHNRSVSVIICNEVPDYWLEGVSKSKNYDFWKAANTLGRNNKMYFVWRNCKFLNFLVRKHTLFEKVKILQSSQLTRSPGFFLLKSSSCSLCNNTKSSKIFHIWSHVETKPSYSLVTSESKVINQRSSCIDLLEARRGQEGFRQCISQRRP